jgi:hypothetical protein
MFTGTVDASGLKERLNGTASRVIAAMRARLEAETGRLTDYIKSQKLSGQVLQNRTGNLRNSVFYYLEDRGTEIVGNVDVSMPAAKYGAAQEFGAHIPERVPVTARALHWVSAGGGNVFAMRAKAFDLQARSFMNSSLRERQEAITASIQESINEATSD